MARRVLLIHPPHTRNVEPPLGAALLAADLASAGVAARVLDLNCLAGPALARAAPDGADHRAHRAALHVAGALEALRSSAAYEDPARYRAQVEHYAAALRAASRATPWKLAPADYTDSRYPDFGAGTLSRVAEDPSGDPFFPFFEPVVGRALAQIEPEVVGISVIYRPQFFTAVALAAWLARRVPRARIVLGGGFFGALPPETVGWCDREVGRTAVGDGEPVLRDVLGLPRGEGGAFRDPDFGDVAFDRHFAPAPVIPLATSRGCYWGNCAFCAEAERTFEMDPPDGVLGRLSRLAAAWKPGMFHLTDNAVPPAVLRALADRGSPAPWYGFVRPEPALADADFVRALARSGCVMLQLGLETPVPRLLSSMRKGTDPARFGEILANLRRAGIKSYAYLLFGFPGQSAEDREETVRFLEANPVDFLNASIFRLPPGSAIARQPDLYRIDGLAGGPAAGGLYRRFEGEGGDLRELRRWLSRRFFRHPAVRRAVSRTPRYFKSSHAAYF